LTTKNAAKAIQIVADGHIWGAESAFLALSGFDVDLRILESSEITSTAVKDADVLLTRSGTKVNQGLLHGSRVHFAGTATIGDDHYDKAWLDAQGIKWATAAGSSTESVLEYMLAVLFELQARQLVDLSKVTLGIIGAGRIGGQLALICKVLGITVLINDPPRQRQEGHEGFVSLETILVKADVLSFHTPLIRDASDTTYHLMNAAAFAAFKGVGIINAARGECVDNTALLDWLNQRVDRFTVLDCWENEPKINQTLLAHSQCVIASPHIAGHSLDGKAANTQYVYDALCHYLEIKPVWNMNAILPEIERGSEQVPSNWQDMHVLSKKLYDIDQDAEALKAYGQVSENALAKGFVNLRRHYPIRRSWVKQSNFFMDVFKAEHGSFL